MDLVVEGKNSPAATAAACVNCGISLKRKWRALAVKQTVENIAFISENIAPNVLTECDYVCKSCSQLSIKIIDNSKINLEGDNDSMEVSNMEEQQEAVMVTRVVKQSLKQACLLCGTPLIERQSQLILKDNPSHIDHLMCEVIKNALSTKIEITADDKLCTKCWATSKRNAFAYKKGHSTESGTDNSKSSDSSMDGFPDNGYDEPLISPIKSEPEDDDFANFEMDNGFYHNTLDNGNKQEQSNKSGDESENEKLSDSSETYQDDPEDLDFIPRSIKNKPSNNENVHSKQNTEIQLPNYRRSPNTRRRCIFMNCKNLKLLKVRNEIIARVLRDHHYFITASARVCSKHLIKNDWDKLYHQTNSIPIFNAADVERIINLVRIKRKNLDFDNVLNLDENLFKFLLGITKETFSDIMEKIPELNKWQMGLVALLINQYQENNNCRRLSRLLNMSRSTMRYHINTVKIILKNHPLTKTLGIIDLLKKKD